MRDPSFVNLQSLPDMAQGLADRRLHRVDRDARPDPRGHRPVKGRAGGLRDAGAPRRAAPPGWDEGVRLDEDPATIPDPASVDVPAAPARRDRGPHGQVPRPPLGRAARAGRGAGGARLVLARGDRPGGGGHAGHARLPVERGDLLRHAAHRARSARATCTSARAWPATWSTPSPCTRRSAPRRVEQGLEDFEIREFECLGACDMAPMASIDGRYVGPLSEDDAPSCVSALKQGRAAAARARRCPTPASGCPGPTAARRPTAPARPRSPTCTPPAAPGRTPSCSTCRRPRARREGGPSPPEPLSPGTSEPGEGER